MKVTPFKPDPDVTPAVSVEVPVPVASQSAVAFIESSLKANGKPAELQPWQRKLIEDLAKYRAEGYEIVAFQTPRGHDRRLVGKMVRGLLQQMPTPERLNET